MSTIGIKDRRLIWASSSLLLLFNGVLLLWLVFHPGPHSVIAAVDNVAQTIGAFLGIVLCGAGMFVAAPWRQPQKKTSSWRWRQPFLWIPLLLGLAIAGQCVGQTIYTVYEQFFHQTFPFPSWADAGYLSAYPFLLLGILLLPRSGLRTSARSRVLLDALMIMIAMITFSWYFILGPTMLQGAETLFAKLVGAAYPFADLVLIFCLLLLVFRSSQRAFRPVLWLLILALLIIVLADSLLDYQSLQGAYTTGGIQDVLWPLGYMLIGLAAQVFCVTAARGQKAEERSVSSAQRPATSRILWWRYLLPSAFIPAILLLIVYVSQTPAKGPLVLGVYSGSAIFIGFVLLRQILALRETQVYADRTQDLNAELQQANSRLESLATMDPLTEISNHRTLVTLLEQEVERVQRYARPSSILFLDIDHFKALNDSYGHAAGDSILCEFTRQIKSVLRTIDTLGRWGGEEFVSILPEVSAEEALLVAERIRASIASHIFEGGGGVHLTCSIGFASLPDHASTGRDLICAADHAMYGAKRFGRNQVRAADDPAVLALNVPQIGEGGRDAAALLGTVEALAMLVEVRNPSSGDHGQRVCDLVFDLALALGLSAPQAQMLALAGKLHDVGKIAIADAILQKPGSLTENEWSVMHTHPMVGAEVVSRIPSLRGLAAPIRAHHERWDGMGYPQRLAGESIPLGARIIAVADTYAVVTADRSYQHLRSPQVALAELRQAAGTQFDPHIVDVFEQMLLSQMGNDQLISESVGVA